MAAARRSNRSASGRQRKDRVLQARIPEQLEAELRDQASRLGLSVSTIVRNTLLNTFNLVGDIVSDSARIAHSLTFPTGTTTKANAPMDGPDSKNESILAWQPGTLNINGVCHQCNALLPKGTRAGVGVPAHERPVFLCMDCLQQLETHAEKSRQPDDDKAPAATGPRSP